MVGRQPSCLAGEAQPQGVVVRHDGSGACRSELGGQRRVGGEQQGLVEVVRLGRVLLEEPVLDGRQGAVAGDRPLLGLRPGVPGRRPAASSATVWCWKS